MSQKPLKEPKSEEIIGQAYKEPKRLTEQFAKSDYSVLFVGETGSGKERFAQRYMKKNPRHGEKRSINCAAFTDELLGSEVFGHVKGAFTGAVKSRDGLLTACKDGVLFLDELGAASSAFQTTLLRVREDQKYSPVGADSEKESDVRLIAATNDLSGIREDLKQAFNIIVIPPLQAFDIPLLAEHFLERPLTENALNELYIISL